MTDTLAEETLHEAKLIAIEDGLAEFNFIGDTEHCNGGNPSDENIFFWPENKLPEGIEVGDVVSVGLDYRNKEERLLQIKKKREKEAKHTEMRKMLEDLVN